MAQIAGRLCVRMRSPSAQLVWEAPPTSFLHMLYAACRWLAAGLNHGPYLPKYLQDAGYNTYYAGVTVTL